MNESPEIHSPWYGRMSVQLVEMSKAAGGWYWIVDERVSDTDGIFAESITYDAAADAWRAMMNNEIIWQSTYSEIEGIVNVK